MVRVKAPINTEDVKERAARKLSQLSASQNAESASVNNVGIRPMVKPIQVSKTDPLVKRITSFQKSN
ncbi:hypothetical protein [Sporosarcina sp. NPDC096371]|uniref:hypothetical protein n=1 Tax=Sporosarcina sp. NPDC096371 TaxID=3364530 RepID=UPI00381BA41C